MVVSKSPNIHPFISLVVLRYQVWVLKHWNSQPNGGGELTNPPAQNTWRPQHLHHHRWLAHQHPCRIPISSILPGMLGSPKGEREFSKKTPNEIMRGVFTAWFKTWRWMDDNGFRNVFWDGLKENQLSLDQLGRISILTFSFVWVLEGDADRIWRQQASFFLELGSRTILEA